ncbi:MAG: LptF/LptG family permease [Saprospiraceae bacterium]
MIRRIDKYIIFMYWRTFLFVCLVMSMIAMVIDYSEKVEEFIDESVAGKEIIFDYYLNFILWINGLLLPLFVLIAVIFFTSRLAGNSEIISILNAGVSFNRMMRPYLIAGGVIAALHLIGNHYVIPRGNKTKLDFEHAYVWKESDKGKTRDIHMFLAPGEKAFVRYYRKKDTTLVDFRLERFEDNELKWMLKARSVEWKGEPDKWLLRGYEIRTFDGLREKVVNGEGKTIDTTLNLHPSDFVRYINQKEMLTTPELKQFIQKEQIRGLANTRIYEIEIYRRTADPFAIIILSVIGMAVAARKVRGGLGLHLALGIALSAIFIFLSRLSVTFATSEGMPALLGVWLPNLVFSGVAAVMVWKAQK